MRYSAPEKLEIIQLVEHSHLLYKFGFDLTGVWLSARFPLSVDHAAAIVFSFAKSRLSRKVCIGVFP